jgi:formylglycine-generating enzyme required for sulfatase activity
MMTTDTSTAEPAPDLRPGTDSRIELLLDALRHRGFVITAENYRHLSIVFPKEQLFSRNQARMALTNLLAKNAAQRRTIHRLFDQLFPQQGDVDTLESGRSLESPASRISARRPSKAVGNNNRRARVSQGPRQNFWFRRHAVLMTVATISLAFVTAIVLFALRGHLTPDSPTDLISLPPIPPPSKSPDPLALPADPVEYFHSWVPFLEVKVSGALAHLGPPLGLFFGAALGLAWLWQRTHDRTTLDFRTLPLAEAGADDFHWPSSPSAPPPLLDGISRREMIWGVTRFESERLLRRLDIPLTVSATARAGLPEIHFAHAIQSRQVWLWIDVTCPNPTLSRLVEEIQQVLQRSGLEVHIGRFRGIPRSIALDTGETLEPEDLESETRQAAVAILTDGAAIIRALEQPEERAALHRRLGDLQEWPRLCLVDFGHGEYGLQNLARRHRLACIRPQELSYWLADRPPEPSAAETADADIDTWLWASCCALPERPITETQALQLHHALGLERGWRFETIRNQGLRASLGIAFSTSQRQTLLRDLADRAREEQPIRRSLARALYFWQRQLKATDNDMEQEARLDKMWGNALGDYRLRLASLLLSLWQDPRKTADDLYDLYQLPSLKDEIRESLARYAALGFPSKEKRKQGGHIVLPWLWNMQPAKTRARLLRMGFAGAQQVHTTADATSRTLLGILCGVATIGLITTLIRFADSDPKYLYAAQVYQSPRFTRLVTPPVKQNGRVYVSSHKLFASVAAPPYTTLQVHWCWSGLESERAAPGCQQLYTKENERYRRNAQFMGQSLLLHAGSLAEPVRACASQWPDLSVAVIAAAPTDPPARRLAIRLLDKGSIDLALIGLDWADQAKTLAKRWGFVTNSQWLFFTPQDSNPEIPKLGRHLAHLSGEFETIAKELNFSGARPAATALGETAKARMLRGSPQIWGGPKASPTHSSGIEFVRLCPGTFTMGSRKQNDPMADTDELPAHPVIMDGFEIARSETTRGQYASLIQTKESGQLNLPITAINWNQARKACRAIESDLPSEAQWEYAARAGTQTPWFWGANEAGTDSFAWFSANSGNKVQPAKSRAANPWGLYDMSGNVYEWVKDCYANDTYQSRGPHPTLVPIEDPFGCDSRVLRGGSFLNGPRDLRSAGRGRGRPGGRDVNVGFRCVRGSGRQFDN